MLSRKAGTWDAPGVLAFHERMNSVAWSSGTTVASVTLALPQSRALLSSLCYTVKVSFAALRGDVKQGLCPYSDLCLSHQRQSSHAHLIMKQWLVPAKLPEKPFRDVDFVLRPQHKIEFNCPTDNRLCAWKKLISLIFLGIIN